MTVTLKRSASAIIEAETAASSTPLKRPKLVRESQSDAVDLLLFLSNQTLAMTRPSDSKIWKARPLPPPSFEPIHVSEDEEEDELSVSMKIMPIDKSALHHTDYMSCRQRMLEEHYILPPIGRPLAPPPSLPKVPTGVILRSQN